MIMFESMTLYTVYTVRRKAMAMATVLEEEEEIDIPG